VPAELNAMIDRVIGNYRIVEKVGEGGMGTVYRALDVMLEREVAIKAIRPELSREPEIVERFRAEAKMLARLSHPAIATIYSFFVDGEDVFLAMEFVRGRSLSGLLQSAGPLPWERAVPLLAGALDGIEQAHRVGIVHRDLKSDNLMVTESGTVKVMDFGIARLIGSSRLTRTGLLVGTLHYMAPEQIRGEEVDRRTDVYALGAVLYEMLTGRVPFQGASDYAVLKAHVEEHPAPPSAAMPGLPPWLDQAILKALAKAPADRFQTVEDLRLCLQGQGSAAAAAGPTFVIPAADQPTLHMAPTVAAARPPSAATLPAAAVTPPAPAATPPRPAAMPPGPPGLAMPPSTPATPPPTRFATPSPAPAAPPPAPIPPSSPAQAASPATLPGWGGGGRRRGAVLLVTGVLAALVAAAVLYRALATPPVRPRAPNAGTAVERAAGSAAGPVTTGNAALPRGVPGGAGGPGGIGGIGGNGGASAKEKAGTGAGSAGAGGGGAGAAGAGSTSAGGTSAGGAATGADVAGARGAEPRTHGKRARLGDAPSSTRRADTPADAASSTAPAGKHATGAETESAGGKDDRAASATGAGSGSTAGGAPDDELRQLGSELEPESDQIRNLYADFLSQKDKGGSRLTDTDDKLKDELKDLQRAVDGFRVQFQTGFWARTRKGFGRFSHSEDQKAQIARVARALVGNAARVDALMAQVNPDPAVRDLWRRIHRQCQRIAEICGL
jgi:tRNA A-37 threonylcarbamoyl transferase component Bud32